MQLLQLQAEPIAEMLFSAAEEVFTSMLGTELKRDATIVESIPHHFDGFMSFVGLAGDWIGAGFVFCDGKVGADLASRLLMSQFEAVDDEVLDAVGEVTNMIVGSAKNQLEECLGPIKMSIPTVVFGKNLSTRAMRTDVLVSTRCSYEVGDILLSLCLTKG